MGFGKQEPIRERQERGATLVEYVLLLSLIAAIVIGAVSFVGNGTSGKLNVVGNGLANAGSASSSASSSAAIEGSHSVVTQPQADERGHGDGCGGVNNDGTDNNGGQNNDGCPPQ